jgi:hypothetical protein
MANQSVVLPVQAIPELRRVIAIGMAAVGQLERLQGLAELAESQGQAWPDEQKPVHPTGSNLMEDYASALMWLDLAAPSELPA